MLPTRPGSPPGNPCSRSCAGWAADAATPERGGCSPSPAADGEQVGALTCWLDEQARDDEEFAALPCGWAARHAPALRAERSEVRNTVAGSARVRGR
ncbi:hypothetical protein ACFYMO_07105 [Streptomyces sp. NPDC007025]|uniref:hypothetical protein n=1 Tax=Streptomyces sp. NPDC007025 TaxID=3364771 RepID=UPI00369002AF